MLNEKTGLPLINPTVNEVTPEMYSLHAIFPFIPHVTSARAAMVGSHMSSRPEIADPQPMGISTGLSLFMGDYTYKINIPNRSRILAKIERYPQNIIDRNIPLNPETTVIYQEVDSGMISFCNVTNYDSNHTYFAFKYKHTPEYKNLRVGEIVDANTTLAQSHSVGKQGEYNFGTMANVALMSIPECAEDAMLLSESFVQRLRTTVIERRHVLVGGSDFLLNLYSDNPDIYKPLPEIGEYTRDDGIILGMRKIDDCSTIAQRSKKEMMQPDHTFDKLIAARPGKGRVVDLKIYHDFDGEGLKNPHTELLDKYARSLIDYYKRILDIYDTLQRKSGQRINISPEFSRLLVTAHAMLNVGDKANANKKLNKMFRKQPLNLHRNYYIIIDVEYTLTPNIGFKVTDTHGSKGVASSRILPDHMMPVDKHGNVAEVVADPAAVSNRNNVGRLYEHYWNASARDLMYKIRNELGIPKGHGVDNIVKILNTMEDSVVNYYCNEIKEFHKIISEKIYNFLNTLSPEDMYLTLAECIHDRLYMIKELDDQAENLEITMNLIKRFPALNDTVIYTGSFGEPVETKEPVMIAELYMMLLEKIADDGSAVDSCAFNTHGVLSSIVSADTGSLVTERPNRSWGETEARLLMCCAGDEATAEIMSHNGDVNVHREDTRVILRHPTPSNIDRLIDRNKFPYGGSRALAIYNHYATISGVKLKYVKDEGVR